MELGRIKDHTHINAFAKNLYLLFKADDQYDFNGSELLSAVLSSKYKIFKNNQSLYDGIVKYLLVDFEITKDDPKERKFIEAISLYSIALLEITTNVEVSSYFHDHKHDAARFDKAARDGLYSFKNNLFTLVEKHHNNFLTAEENTIPRPKYLDALLCDQIKQLSPNLSKEDLMTIVRENTTQYSFLLRSLEEWVQTDAFFYECICFSKLNSAQIQKAIKHDFFYLISRVSNEESPASIKLDRANITSYSSAILTNLYLIETELSKYIAPASWPALNWFSNVKLLYAAPTSSDSSKHHYKRNSEYDVYFDSMAEGLESVDPKLMTKPTDSFELGGTDRHIMLFLSGMRFENESNKAVPANLKKNLVIPLKDFAVLFGNGEKEFVSSRTAQRIKQHLIKLFCLTISTTTQQADGNIDERHFRFINELRFSTKNGKTHVHLEVGDSFYKIMCENHMILNFRDFNIFSISSDKDIYFSIEKLIIQKSLDGFAKELVAYLTEEEISSAAGLTRRPTRNTIKIDKVCKRALADPGTFLLEYSLDDRTNTFYFVMKNPFSEFPLLSAENTLYST